MTFTLSVGGYEMGFSISGSVIGVRVGQTGTGKPITFVQLLSTDDGGERSHLYDVACFGSVEQFPGLRAGSEVQMQVSVDVYSGKRGPQLAINHYPPKKSVTEGSRPVAELVPPKKQNLPG